jgi:hypothetical protein
LTETHRASPLNRHLPARDPPSIRRFTSMNRPPHHARAGPADLRENAWTVGGCIRIALLLAAGLGLFACRDSTGVSGAPGRVLPRTHPRRSTYAPIPKASWAVPTPQQSTDGAYTGSSILPPTDVPGGVLATGKWYHIVVSDPITLTKNALSAKACTNPCWPLDGKQIYPYGYAPDSAQAGWIRPDLLTREIATGKVSPPRDVYASPTDRGALELLWDPQYDQQLMIQRSGHAPTQTCWVPSTCPGTGTLRQVNVELYTPSGSQRVVVDEVPKPLEVVGPTIVKKGQAVTFSANVVGPFRRRNLGGGTVYTVWKFHPNDTVPNYENPNISGISIPECGNTATTCTFTPAQPGRVSATTTVEARTVVDRSDPIFPVDNLLGVTCTSPVTRGTRSTCTASVSPATSFTVMSWSFDGDTHRVHVESTVPSTTWELLPPVTGTVTVEAVIGGRNQLATARIIVNDCDLLASTPTDTLLLDPVVQAYLIDLARRTNWNGPVQDWQEHGGYLVEHDGGIVFHEYRYRPGMPTACNSDHYDDHDSFEPGDTLLLEPHTHPTAGDSIDNTGNVCPGNPATFIGTPDGPSGGAPGRVGDLTPWKRNSEPYQHAGVVIDPLHLHWWKNTGANGGQTLNQEQYDLNTGPTRCVI